MTLRLLAALALAATAPGFGGLGEEELAKELAGVHAAQGGLEARLDAVSERFLGTPYKLGPLGEGEAGEYDRDPLISFTQADCTTFVEQVLALSLEPDLEKAKALLQRIRYREGRVSYETRNHFPETDWIPNNVAAGFLTDITRKTAGGRVRWAFKTIRKADWYLAKSTSDLEGFAGETLEQASGRVERWRAAGAELKPETARLPYLPLEHLPELAASIPSGTIGNVVRADLPEKPVLVTHQVLLFQRPEGTIIRHAAYGKQVQDEPALDYFARFKGAAWPVLGLNLNAVATPGPKTP